MSTTHLSAIGVYPTATQAEAGVNVLIENGFNSDGIHLLLPKQRNTKSLPGQPARSASPPRGTRTSAIAAIGATAGGALIGCLGVVVGSGGFNTPALAPLVAAGPLITGIGGLCVGAILGAIAGFLLGTRLQEDRTHRHIGQFEAGPTLLLVNCDNGEDVARAKAALARSGAQDISSGSDVAPAL
ncbi:MAG TPA: hypothetical protein VMF03_01180 [Steroidobacteraceae bacterium]|nr:hypothetical protein [Steroidobacteraceae bacterium]